MQKFVLLSLLAVVLVGVESHFGSHLSGDSFERYATMKIFEDCYGKENVKQWHHEVKQAVNKCRNESDDQSTSSAFTYMMDMFKRFQNRVEQQQLLKSQMFQAFAIFAQDASQQQRFEQRPMMAQYFDDQSHRASPFMANRFPAPSRYAPVYQKSPYYHYEDFVGIRKTRAAGDKVEAPKDQKQALKNKEEPQKGVSPVVTENPLDAVPQQIREMFQHLQYQISNTTCILREMKFFGDDNMPNYESVKSRVKMMNMPEDVKTDLHKGIEYCSKITSCLPEDEHSGMMKPLAKPMAFFKCFQGKKLETCMKKDMRERFGEFFDDEMMTMSRQFEQKSMSPDSVFDMVYGFKTSEMQSMF